MIARTGPAPFRARGLAEDPGTSLVTISGAVQHPGVVEIDRGTPLIDVATRAVPTDSPQAILVGGFGGAWVGPWRSSRLRTASLSLRAIGATAGVGIVIVLGTAACGLTESAARIVQYLAAQRGTVRPLRVRPPGHRRRPGPACPGTRRSGAAARRLDLGLHDVEGRGGCRHPDGAVQLARSALRVFASDADAHGSGSPCPHWNNPSQLRFCRAHPEGTR